MSDSLLDKKDSLPWYAALILIRPGRIAENLKRITQSGIVKKTPNRWQILLGVMRMLYRSIFYSETVGLTDAFPMRKGWRARVFLYRPLRFPFLLWEGSVVPLDLSGLASSPEILMRHCLGTHHDGDRFFYDLRLLSVHSGQLEELRRRTLEVINNDNRRSRWLRDLCVYEQYHEELLKAVERALAGDWLVDPGLDAIDTGLEGYLNWCATRPDTPGQTWTAWRAGTLGLNDPSIENYEKQMGQEIESMKP